MASRRVNGWADLIKRMAQIKKNMDDIIPLMQKEAPRIRSQMQLRARVRTGYMRDNIIENNLDTGFEIWSNAPYSGWQEFGTTRGITPNLFFRPPVAQANVDLPKLILKELTK